MAHFELWDRETLEKFAAEATRKLLDNDAEIERLRRYADAMNGKLGTERHVYNGMCPDNGQPDSRDPKCPACRLLVPNAKLTGG